VSIDVLGHLIVKNGDKNAAAPLQGNRSKRGILFVESDTTGDSASIASQHGS
jgi:hypothetical protein